MLIYYPAAKHLFVFFYSQVYGKCFKKKIKINNSCNYHHVPNVLLIWWQIDFEMVPL